MHLLARGKTLPGTRGQLCSGFGGKLCLTLSAASGRRVELSEGLETGFLLRLFFAGPLAGPTLVPLRVVTMAATSPAVDHVHVARGRVHLV